MTREAAAPLGIIELGAVCARQRAINLDLFERLGNLVTASATTAGADQQLLAAACHRHAWHAELWAGRAPSIPPVHADGAFDRSVDAHRGNLEFVTDVATYHSTAAALRAELTDLLERVDPLLDPSTARTIQLVLADLAD
ncbi:MAG TPA: hypothetical protein VMM60_00775 [Ilumatobacter sp.]|nr:hypothetical protein [Ilumatobacter sp.]